LEIRRVYQYLLPARAVEAAITLQPKYLPALAPEGNRWRLGQEGSADSR
jgi:hypothetical protein